MSRLTSFCKYYASWKICFETFWMFHLLPFFIAQRLRNCLARFVMKAWAAGIDFGSWFSGHQDEAGEAFESLNLNSWSSDRLWAFTYLKSLRPWCIWARTECRCHIELCNQCYQLKLCLPHRLHLMMTIHRFFVPDLSAGNRNSTIMTTVAGRNGRINEYPGKRSLEQMKTLFYLAICTIAVPLVLSPSGTSSVICIVANDGPIFAKLINDCDVQGQSHHSAFQRYVEGAFR